MNYRHIYHAGNFADVLKHWILTLILEQLSVKEKPFFVLDANAGIGVYPFESEQINKSAEYAEGIGLLLQADKNNFASSYMHIVNKFIKDANAYPGSPAIIQEFLRAKDRLVLVELHKDDCNELQQNFGFDPRIRILNVNAYAALKSLLPPLERRGLILIDPSFELKNEFKLLTSGLQNAITRFANGIYMIWFPIKDYKQIKEFYKSIQMIRSPQPINGIIIELFTKQQMSTALNSCGVIVLNAPWKLPAIINMSILTLLECLNLNEATYNLFELNIGASN